MSVSPIGGRAAPNPPRPLGPEGTRFWLRLWGMPAAWINPVMDLEYVTILCESMDERSMLRLAVFQNTGDWRDRVALRNIETQITTMLSCLGLNPTDRKAIALPGGAEGAAASRLAQLRHRTKARPS